MTVETVYAGSTPNVLSSLSGKTARVVMPASLLLVDATKIRLEVLQYSNNYWQVDNIFIGHSDETGDSYDFDGNQVRITFNDGDNGFTASSGLWSDWVSFDLDKSKDLIISFAVNSGSSGVCYFANANIAGYYWNGDVASTSNLNLFGQLYTKHVGFGSIESLVEAAATSEDRILPAFNGFPTPHNHNLMPGFRPAGLIRENRKGFSKAF